MPVQQVTIKKLAELAGVSRATVDKVLNGRPGVKTETEERIREIAKALNYQPNVIGKALVSKEPVKLGIILTPEYNPFVVEMLNGIKQAELDYSMFNLSVSVQMLSTLEPAEQISILHRYKSDGIQGIGLFAFDNEQVKHFLNSFAEDGISIVTVNSRVEGINNLCFVGQDHRKGGATAAGLMSKLLSGGGDIGVIISSYNLSCHKDRLSGFRERIISKNSNLRIVEVQENQDRFERAFEITLDYCNRYPELSGIYLTSGGVNGCAKALKISKKESLMKLICHDVTPEVKELLSDGVLDFAIDQNPQAQGYQLVKVLFEYLVKKQRPEPYIEIPIGIITADIL